MVLGNVSDEWRQRLAALRAARQTPASDVEAWLIEIRIRILDYLVRRYGDVGSPTGTLEDDREPRPPGGPLERDDRWDGVEHPPLAASAMAPALRRIRDHNQVARLRCGRPGPEIAWRWFADTYCRAGSTPSSGTLDAD